MTPYNAQGRGVRATNYDFKCIGFTFTLTH